MPRKSIDNVGRGALDRIERSDSLAMKEEAELHENLVDSQTYENLFQSVQPILLQESGSSENFYKTYSP